MAANRLAIALREREEAFQQFAEWQAANLVRLDPGAALAAVGALYELCHPPMRHPPDPAGVMAFHLALRRFC
jgi:hypothetical protein